ncbi:hypothetical protein ACVWZZ_006068 [Bradyrhizobium sp. LM6.10]
MRLSCPNRTRPSFPTSRVETRNHEDAVAIDVGPVHVQSEFLGDLRVAGLRLENSFVGGLAASQELRDDELPRVPILDHRVRIPEPVRRTRHGHFRPVALKTVGSGGEHRKVVSHFQEGRIARKDCIHRHAYLSHLADAFGFERVSFLDAQIAHRRSGRPLEKFDLRGRGVRRNLQEFGDPLRLPALRNQVQKEGRPSVRGPVVEIDRSNHRVGTKVPHRPIFGQWNGSKLPEILDFVSGPGRRFVAAILVGEAHDRRVVPFPVEVDLDRKVHVINPFYGLYNLTSARYQPNLMGL